MIHIQVWRDQAGQVHQLKVKGHADYAPHGQDIVCAAVSAIAQTAVIGLTDQAGIDMDGCVIIKDGLVEITLPDLLQQQRPAAYTILNTAALGLRSIQMAQPGFVHYQERRWQPCLK